MAEKPTFTQLWFSLSLFSPWTWSIHVIVTLVIKKISITPPNMVINTQRKQHFIHKWHCFLHVLWPHSFTHSTSPLCTFLIHSTVPPNYRVSLAIRPEDSLTSTRPFCRQHSAGEKKIWLKHEQASAVTWAPWQLQLAISFPYFNPLTTVLMKVSF